MRGQVKWFNEVKGYGFILGDDGQDYFLHVSELPNFATVDKETEVEFEVKRTAKGEQATNVKIL